MYIMKYYSVDGNGGHHFKWNKSEGELILDGFVHLWLVEKKNKGKQLLYVYEPPCSHFLSSLLHAFYCWKNKSPLGVADTHGFTVLT